jgi:hypothetical protein
MSFVINGSEGNGFPEETQEEVGANYSAPTPLVSLKARRDQIVNDLYVDIQVPRWDNPEIYVRFKPVSAIKLNASIERRRKQKGDDWSLLANADVLVENCIGIYGVIPGESAQVSLRPNDPYGTWTRFDTDLAEALGLDTGPGSSAAKTCIALYLTEGDLIDTANRLFKWSNIADNEADETF